MNIMCVSDDDQLLIFFLFSCTGKNVWFVLFLEDLYFFLYAHYNILPHDDDDDDIADIIRKLSEFFLFTTLFFYASEVLLVSFFKEKIC